MPDLKFLTPQPLASRLCPLFPVTVPLFHRRRPSVSVSLKLSKGKHDGGYINSTEERNDVSSESETSTASKRYAMTGQITQKSDVYSFGVVLLELLTGRKPVDHTMPKEKQSLVNFSSRCLCSMKQMKCFQEVSRIRPLFSNQSQELVLHSLGRLMTNTNTCVRTKTQGPWVDMPRPSRGFLENYTL